MKRFKILMILVILELITSCSFLCDSNRNKNKNDKNVEEKKYEKDIKWQLELESCYDSEYALQDGKYYYVAERRIGYDIDFFYSKIDLSTGTKIWETESFKDSPCNSNVPLKVILNGKECLIVSSNEQYIYVIDDISGSLLATVKFFNEEKDEDYYRFELGAPSWCYYDTCLYWAPGRKLVRLNLNQLSFSQSSKEAQYIQPEILWTNQENKERILIWPVIQNGIIYFVTYDDYPEIGYCILGAYDTVANKMKWKRTSDILTGYGFNNMIIAENKLYIIEDAQGCYDLETGETIWEQNETEEELRTQISIGAGCYSKGITYNDGKLYFTNGAASSSSMVTGIAEKYLKNIQCIDAKTGKYLWGDFPYESASLYTKPVVVNNQCFVRTWDDLRVYNAETGEFLGRDNGILSIGREVPVSYKNTFIYIQKDYQTGSGILTAINVYDIEDEE